MIYLISIIVFTSVMLLSAALLYQLLLRKSVLVARLDTLFPKQAKTKQPVESGTWAYKLSRIGETVKLPPQEHSKYTKMLVAAGCSRDSVYRFFGWKILLASGLPLLFLFLYATPRQVTFTSQSIPIMVACAISGYLLPSYWLYAKKKNRQLQIFHTLPDVLDLMTVCVEAGLSMDAALIKTTETPQFDKDPLAQEIKIATMETRAGKPRIESLKDMAERTMVDDVKSFVTMLAQTERFGTSLSQALRSYADSLRIKRRQIAEEAAAKTTIKMVFPLILFIFPALLVVILGPALIQISKIFK
ncbi:MAG: secretion system protein [Geobacteraceae bacterium GWC2_58_44]|nr:MAG: secretion system protein [Geobacteraceae bacterium GWC2_58_44]HBG07421.1 secretion system protein [Geobacter sp.]